MSDRDTCKNKKKSTKNESDNIMYKCTTHALYNINIRNFLRMLLLMLFINALSLTTDNAAGKMVVVLHGQTALTVGPVNDL